MKGLFLGAGASYEVGMPLVWEFSQTLRENVIKRLETKLFNFENDEELKKYFIEILSNEELHYEQVVGLLEKRKLHDRSNNQRIHGIIIQLIECIQLLLLEEQSNTLKFLSERIKDYYGIKALIDKENVFNIFSLNHDIVFEEILDYFRIPYKDGFYKRNSNYSNVANFKVITSDELAAEDKGLFLKVYGDAKYVGSNYAEIRKVESRNIEIAQRDGIRATNELYVHDSLGELQFLRRSLLSGAHKFQDRFDQIIPISLLSFFKKRLINTSYLTVIGYSFGDPHINDALVEWLSDESRTIEIYDPFITSVPKGFEAHFKQFKIVNGGLTDYFMTFDSSLESWANQSKREMFNTIRDNLKERRLNKKA